MGAAALSLSGVGEGTGEGLALKVTTLTRFLGETTGNSGGFFDAPA